MHTLDSSQQHWPHTVGLVIAIPVHAAGEGGRDEGSNVSTGEAAVPGARGRPPQRGVSDQLWISKLDVKHAQK